MTIVTEKCIFASGRPLKGKIKVKRTALSLVTQRSWERSSKKPCLTGCCSFTPFSPYDGWVILYTINPSICQLLMESLKLRVERGEGRGAGLRNCQMAECHLASLLTVITEPAWKKKLIQKKYNRRLCLSCWWLLSTLSFPFWINSMLEQWTWLSEHHTLHCHH